jgi:hypothetical protein
MSRRLSSSVDYEALLDDYDTWLFDCDGVLWRGDQVIDGVVQVLNILRQRGGVIDCFHLTLSSHSCIVPRKETRFCHQQRYKVSGKLQEEI